MKIRTITFDFWGTLLHDGPSSDDRYKRTRLTAFENILASAGETVPRNVLDRGYDESGAYLGRIWSTHRDVPVQEHVRALLAAVEPTLPDRLSGSVMAALVEAYARPALLVPPAVDGSARGALEALRERGYTLAVVSNTMRTPGATLRKSRTPPFRTRSGSASRILRSSRSPSAPSAGSPRRPSTSATMRSSTCRARARRACG
ncbi:MAG: hypothetical protein AUH81_14320 [Candidatus Rokubacteria bacterium 13_1_40CM_4_69_5]|nr:MAG: hypothetical protein AUH81_14320 [Candidatus Rokubacteria bacterium 13_1_40CM_4_69_5]